MLKADGQTNPLPLRQVERINSTNYSIHIEKNEPLNLNALRESELNKLFSTNWNKLPKFKPSSFWFYIDICDIQAEIFEIYAPGTVKINASSVYFDKSGKNNVERIAISEHRNDFHLLEISKNTGFLFINIQTNRYSNFVVKPHTKKSLFLKERQLNVYYGFIVGVFLLLALYHLVFILRF